MPKVTIYETKTGKELTVESVDARELVAGKSYTKEPPKGKAQPKPAQSGTASQNEAKEPPKDDGSDGKE